MNILAVSLSALHIVIAIIGIMILGASLRAKGILRHEADVSLFSLTVNVLTPCLILKNVLFTDAFSDPRNIFLPPLIGFLCVTIGSGVAWLFAKLLPQGLSGLENTREIGTFVACLGVYNYGFVPIPMIETIFPVEEQSRMLGILFLQNLGVDIALWTIIVVAISGRFQRDSWKKVVNAPTISIAFALLVHAVIAIPGFPKEFCTENILPHLTFFRKGLDLLGASAIPMTVLLVGATIAEQFDDDSLKRQWRRGLKIVAWSCLIRLGLLPLVFMFLAVAMPVPIEIRRILVIHGAMASAVFPIIMAKHFGGDRTTALYAVLGNTLLSIVTAPLWVAFGLFLIEPTAGP